MDCEGDDYVQASEDANQLAWIIENSTADRVYMPNGWCYGYSLYVTDGDWRTYTQRKSKLARIGVD